MNLYHNHHKKQIIIFIFSVIFLLSGNGLNFFTSATAQTETGGSGERYVSIDFNDVDISVFIKFISELTGKNFVIDNRVKGKVTIISPSKISVDEAYKVFESVLEVYGFATVESGEVVKIISSPEARTKNIETLLKEEARSPDDKIVTQLIPLRYADPGDIKRLFAPLISKSSVLLDYPATDTLIITDVYSNIRRLLKILKTIDVPGVGQTISIIPLEYSDAEKMVRLLTTIFQQKGRAKKAAADDVSKFVSDDRTNTVIMLASEDETVKVKELISRLDKEVPKGKGNIHVYYLENAKAEELAKVLQSLSTKARPSQTKGKKEAPIVSEATNITFDKATNSLIIMAEKDDYQVLEEVIRKLDVRRAMVYIECLIMEVNVDKGFNLGVEWLTGGKTDYEGKTGYFGGGFSGGENGYSNITSLGSGNFPNGFSLGVTGTPFVGEIAGQVFKFPNIGAIVNAYKKDKDVYILSTPQILTTDNEEASITVGKNVPYQTREGTGTTTTTDSNYSTYNTYEYKDVAIKLTITPQISKDRLIRLKIAQEVSKLDSSSAAGDARPTTLKRTIDTTVVVNDKNTIVLGGLIDDSFSTTEYKIPCVGDVPWLGWLFKSMSRGRERTNLFVFLTPHVIENADEASKFYQEKKDKIDSIGKDKEEGIKLYKKEGSEVKIEELKIEDMNE